MTKIYLDPKARALMAGLPGALGASGNAALGGAGAVVSMFDAFLVAQLSQLEANRERLAERTDVRIEVLYDAGRFDERIFEDSEFQGLVFQGAVAAAQETSDEKIDLYAAILAGAASKDRPPDLNMRAILSSVTFLTIEEIRLARRFYEGVDAETTAILSGIRTPLWGPFTDFYLRRLESANLIVPHIVQGLPARFQGERGQYVVTDTFRQLMKMVRQTEPPVDKSDLQEKS